ncbi:universal stress protein [Spongiivirga sp. MCCC 1A20706]|uniref:universal stress protein n=1 Tax=Spongiivirga sp. MCCC 1A20706 TaxID=3160963 RepID=UPI00397745E7
MKKILVPVDFGPSSESALKIASEIAKKFDADILLVHMMGIADGFLTKESYSGNDGIYHLKLVEKKLTDFLDKDYLEGLRISYAIKNHRFFDHIDSVINEQQPDLIVMGTHDSKGFEEFFNSTHTQKLARNTSVPILAVKKQMSQLNTGKAIVACDFSLESAESFKTIIDFCNALNFDVEIVHVNQPSESFKSTHEVENKIEKFATHLQEPYQKALIKINHYDDYGVENGILHVADDKNADLIAVATHGRKGFAHFLLGSVGESIVDDAPVPVLTVKM